MRNTGKKRCTAILLSAGSGSRMKSKTAKQYMLLDGKPIIWYSLQTIEKSEIIDDCILVVAENDLEYVRKEIVEQYDFHKVDTIIAGGSERYLSVGNALRMLKEEQLSVPNRDGYVFIHDGARPFLTEEILRNTYEAAREHHACVAAMPSKDTVKIADENGYARQTPDRKTVWNVQTPQVFDTQLIIAAYNRLWENLAELENKGITITDDAGVVEQFTDQKVKLVEGSYENIKITTPGDMKIAEVILEWYKESK